jgi:hypothetical protein
MRKDNWHTCVILQMPGTKASEQKEARAFRIRGYQLVINKSRRPE